METFFRHFKISNFSSLLSAFKLSISTSLSREACAKHAQHGESDELHDKKIT